MKIDLSGERPEKQKKVTFGDQEFSVCVRDPSYKQQAEDADILMQSSEESLSRHRIESCIVGWEGVENKEGKTIPFSQDSLSAMCEFRGIFQQFLMLSNDAFRGQDEETEKNSDPPSNEA